MLFRYKDRDQLRFAAMLCLTGTYFFVELIWGAAVSSLALMAGEMRAELDGVWCFLIHWLDRVGPELGSVLCLRVAVGCLS